MEDFKIIECPTERIIVNRESKNEEEIIQMRLAAQDAIIREFLIGICKNSCFEGD